MVQFYKLNEIALIDWKQYKNLEKTTSKSWAIYNYTLIMQY